MQVDFTKDEIDELRLGRPFVEFNVDGTQFGACYFPLYKGEKAVGIVCAECIGSTWRVGDGELIDFKACWNVLNELDYEKNEVIVYSINNIWYAESSKKRIELGRLEYDKHPYSDDEKKFLKMDWEEKLETAEKGSQNLKAISTSRYLADDDLSRRTTGGEMQLKEEEIV